MWKQLVAWSHGRILMSTFYSNQTLCMLRPKDAFFQPTLLRYVVRCALWLMVAHATLYPGKYLSSYECKRRRFVGHFSFRYVCDRT
mmetsp:Transcript_23263/g.57733  ORF Transcript_23263/g.57733 Transcript_23263/m.57733 type:complete len:86 (+) Transcript_23263:603-860(+)